MKGFIKYQAKLLIIYMIISNAMPPAAFAAQIASDQVDQATAQTQQVTNQSQDVEIAPMLPMSPAIALPQTSHSFTSGASVLGLSTHDTGNGISAHKRLGVRVQKLFKKDFAADENINLTLDNPDQEKYHTTVTDAAGQAANVQLQEQESNGVTQLEVIPTNQFKPGKYTIKVTDETGQTTSQDFSWGVLALNPDKAVYAPGDTANLSMAVLDDKGAMVCNANVQLQISNPDFGINDTLSTGNGKIKVNSGCTSHAYSLKPDYEASYPFTYVGTYDLTLTAQTGNGSHVITDTVIVNKTTPFVIQRTSATRIYPPHTYPMTINVTAERDFTGTITETVPDSFSVTPANGTTSYDTMKTAYLDNNDPSAQVSKQVLGDSTGLVMPFDGSFPITQGFGSQLTDPTLSAFYNHYGLGGHDGIDFGLPIGTPLYAVDDGKVVWSGPGDYGTQIIIKHSWGQTYYGHMSKTSVEKDADVHKGSLIGYSGMSGEATGPHLHFGMKPDKPDLANGYYGKIDPMPYLPIGRSAITSSLHLGVDLPNVLGASTSAAASDSATTPTPSASPSAAPTASTQPSTNTTAFAVGDTLSQQAAEDQPQTMAKSKVLKWHVSLKKGENITLSYTYKAPQISPQFYLLGSLKFYQDKNTSLVFDEGRQWEIASDDIGTSWYHPNGNSNIGYEWQYRKKLTVDHTQVGQVTSPPTFDHSSTSNSTTSGSGASTISWTNQTVTTGQSNYLLAVWVSVSNATRTVSNVSYNFTGNTTKNQLTRLKTSTLGTGGDFELWYATFPSASVASMNITANLSGSAIFGTGATLLYNVNQATPFGTAVNATSSNTAINVTVTSNNTQLIIDCATNQNGVTGNNWTPQAGNGQTVTFNNTSYIGLQGSYKTGLSPSTTMNWTDNSTDSNADIAVPVNGVTSQSTLAAIQHIQSAQNVTKNATSCSGTTFTANVSLTNSVTAGDLLVLLLSINTNNGVKPTITVSDGVNTWTQAQYFGNTSVGNWEGMYYAQNATAGSPTVTITQSGSTGCEITAALGEYSGISTTNALDQIHSGQGITGSSGAASVSSGSTTATDTATELLVGGLNADSGNVTLSPGSSYTMRQQNVNGNQFEFGAYEDRIVQSTGTYFANMTLGNDTSNWGMGIATFRAATLTGLTNFPVLVNITDADLKNHIGNNVTANDVVFTDSSGATKLSSEIESYDSSNGTITAWVQIPSLSFSSDTNIYMYYGNPSVAAQSSTSTWDSSFSLVNHLGTLANGASSNCTSNLHDSTSNGLDFTCTGPPTTTSGQVDGAYAFSGSTQYLTAAATADDALATGFTVSGWFNPSSVAAANATIMRNDNSTAATANLKGFLLNRATNKLSGGVYTNASVVATGNTTLSTSTWYYGAMTYDGSTVTLYLNGSADGTTASTTSTGNMTLSATSLLAGAGTTGGGFWSGSLDELRVSNDVRSPGWIATEYANQNSPNTFFNNIGNEETTVYACTPDQMMKHGQCFDTTYGRQPFLF